MLFHKPEGLGKGVFFYNGVGIEQEDEFPEEILIAWLLAAEKPVLVLFSKSLTDGNFSRTIGQEPSTEALSTTKPPRRSFQRPS